MIDKTVRELNRLVEAREINITELAEQYIAEIHQHNGHYQAIATFSETSFRLLSETADQMLQSGEARGPLHGIPILIDDLIDVANLRTSYGCEAYSDHVPDVESIVVRRLRDAGALFPGKASTSELGLILEEEEDRFICRSAWGDDFVSGGGTSGVMVGTFKNFAAAAIAVDVGGNVLLPAAFNGMFALVPSYGRIAHTPIYSRGLMFASVALITKDVADSAFLMNIVAGHSEIDPLSVRMPSANYMAAIERPARGLSVALTNALWNAPCDDDHRNAISRIERLLKSANCRVDYKRPPIRESIDAWKTIQCANLHASHGYQQQQNPDQFGAIASEWIAQGAQTSALEYIEAQKRIYGLRLLLREFFTSFDVLIVSAAGCVPFKYGALPSNLKSGDNSVGWQDYASMCNIAAVSGFPTANLPVGLSKEGLPICVIAIAKPGDEDLLLSLCAILEDSTTEYK